MHRGEMLANSVNVIVQIRGAANVTLGEIGNVMEELNRHISDRTQLMMGIAIDSSMGSRLSVSVISSLGGNSERSVRTAYPALQEPERVEAAPTTEAGQEPVVNFQLANEPPPAHGQKPLRLKAPLNLEAGEESASSKEIVPAGKPDPKDAPKQIEAKQEVLQFDAVSRGRFEKSEPTIIDGQDLDVPTFLRRRVKAG
jgi:cell division protein FtsZ